MKGGLKHDSPSAPAQSAGLAWWAWHRGKWAGRRGEGRSLPPLQAWRGGGAREPTTHKYVLESR